jgi:amino acid adenylation domain-containing protein
MWFLYQCAPQTAVYCVPSALELDGTIQVDRLEEAFRAVIQRHDVLRTTFALENGELVQRVALDSHFQLQECVLEATPAEQLEATTERLLTEEIRRPFDLGSGSPLRALLVRLNSERHVLLVTMHHIATDGWSMGLFWRDLELAYSSLTQGRSPLWPELPLRYADYAVWQRERLRSQALDDQLHYWKRNLEGLSRLELPADRPRRAGASANGAQFVLALPQTLAQSLRDLGQREGATLFMTLLAGFQVLLHRYSGQPDIAVGTPIAGRSRQHLDSIIGFFVNTLVMRCHLSGSLSFRETLARIRECVLDAMTHQDLPFEKLVEDLAPARSASANPLFQVMFVFEANANARTSFAGTPAKSIQLPVPGSKFDLMLSVADTGKLLTTYWDYSTDLFDSPTIDRLAHHFQTLLQSIVADPGQKVAKLALLNPAERHQLLSEWNAPSTMPLDNCRVHELFEAQAMGSPEAVAVKSDDGSLSYRNLNAKANQLAHYLKEQGVNRGTLVGISTARSLEMVISVLAILKAGGTYVPIDPDYPNARLQFIIEDTRIPILVTQETWKAKLDSLPTRVICLDSTANSLPSQSETNLTSEGTPEDAAYVNYTSGSTGRPKGVLIPHRGIVRLVRDTDYVSLGPETMLLHASPLSFDASTFELWGTLLNGGCLALMAPGTASLSDLGDAIQRHQINTLWLTAGLFHLMVEHQLEALKSVRQLIAGGDILSPELVLKARRALPHCRLINGYGPTENTTFTCCHTIANEQELAHSVPIGRPIPHTQVYILDENREPVPVGVEGELYTGGKGVALGYLNQPDLTADRFVPDPFSPLPGARMYRTGDRARWKRDAIIEFRGRQDDQVKIRGFRVELGEIESVLANHPDVTLCAVISQLDTTGGHCLAAFIVPKAESTISENSLRAWLRERLPDYMLPSRIELRSTLPLNPNGKVDRRSLAAAPRTAQAAPQGSPPTDPLELRLLELWGGVLHREGLSIDDNFFELGGHSMLAMRLFSELERTLNVKLPLATLFQAPTIRELARVLRDQGWTPPWQTLVPIQTKGTRQPLFLIHGVGGNILGFRDLAIHLGEDQPVFGVQSVGLDGKSPPLDRVERMAEAYLKEILALQPTGPYHLCGLSFGGVVAFELAQQLTRSGHQVGLLALLDTHPPGHAELLPLRERTRERMRSWQIRVQGHWGEISKQEDWRAYLRKKSKTAQRRLKSWIWRWRYQRQTDRKPDLPTDLRDVREANTLAARRYITRPYPGKVTLLLAAEHPMSTKAALRRIWSRIALGGLEVTEVPGDHVTLIEPPHSSVLAQQLRACLAASQA